MDRCRAISRSAASQGACMHVLAKRILVRKVDRNHPAPAASISTGMSLTPELCTKIEGLLAEASGGSLVKSMERVYKLLKDAGLMYTQKVSSMFIGVRPANRDGVGVSARHVHDLLADLVSLGWSSAEFRGMCVELAESERASIFRWNRDLAQHSDGQIADFDSESMLKYCTIAGSHTNQVLRCFQARVASNALHVSDGKNLNLDKLKALDGDFYEAVTEGATWRIVSHLVPEKFPSFCGLAQSAANAAGHVAREESELHLCRKLHTEIMKHSQQTGKEFVTYHDVKDAVLRSKPRAAATVPALFVFTLRYSGGQLGHLLHETEKFVRGHGHNSRVLGPEIYEGLNTELKGRDPQAQLRHMILHFGYSVDEARTLTVTDIKKLLAGYMVAKTGQVVSILTQCREFCSQHSVPSAVSLKALGFLQVQLIAILLDKKKVMKFQTVEEAAEDCINSILKEAKLNLANPFQQQASSSSTGPSSKTPKDDQAMVPLGGRCSHPDMYMYIYIHVCAHISYIYHMHLENRGFMFHACNGSCPSIVPLYMDRCLYTHVGIRKRERHEMLFISAGFAF